MIVTTVYLQASNKTFIKEVKEVNVPYKNTIFHIDFGKKGVRSFYKDDEIGEVYGNLDPTKMAATFYGFCLPENKDKLLLEAEESLVENIKYLSKVVDDLKEQVASNLDVDLSTDTSSDIIWDYGIITQLAALYDKVLSLPDLESILTEIQSSKSNVDNNFVINLIEKV